jgi:NAD(P)-dependent dehydrogenase (short-subunit alcohol dehydrogenase family)
VRQLEHKVCVITGAAGGIGRASVEVFAREGASVIGVDLRGEVDCDLFVTADLTDEAQVRELYAGVAERFGRIDVLFNNAGIAPADDVSVLEIELAAWRRVIEANLTSVLLCCKHGIPHLLRSGGGSVINMASLVACMGSAVSQIAYTASKGGVLAMSRELAVEFARSGVRVNALCPGPVETPMLRSVHHGSEVARRLVHVPSGRFAQAREIAEAAAFLAGDGASYVSGTEFLVDGAITAAFVTPQETQPPHGAVLGRSQAAAS